MTVPSPRASALLLAGFDPVLAGHLAVAVAGYVRAHIAAGAPVPAGVVEVGQALADLHQGCDILRHRADIGAASREHGPPVIAMAVPIPEVAQLVGRTTRTIQRWIRDGGLRHVQVGGRRRVRLDDLAAYLAGAA